jgi:hypothetical protein
MISRINVFAAGLLVALSGSLNAPVLRSQPRAASISPCRVGENAAPIGFWTWPASARVKVYIRERDFTPAQIPHLLDALNNWNDVSDANASSVRFEYQGTTIKSLTCESCVTIMRGAVYDKRKQHVTELHAYSLHHNQIITYAEIVVDPALTNVKALTEALAHELGHNLGLLDCYYCKGKTTLMGKFKEVNSPNNLAQPTPCDISQVRMAYEELKVRVRPSPTSSSSADEGEEPEDDDTPIVVPKP